MDCYVLVDDCIVECQLDEWRGPQRIDNTEVGEYLVSTVFLGIEHVGGMFETMIFGGVLDSHMVRCDTAQEARSIHNKIVEVLRSNKTIEQLKRINFKEI